MTIFNVSLHLKGGKRQSATRGRDFEAENLIVIAERAQQEQENDFRDFISLSCDSAQFLFLLLSLVFLSFFRFWIYFPVSTFTRALMKYLRSSKEMRLV